MGVLSLDAIYFIYYFICILLLCFHIVFLMTISTFELNLIVVNKVNEFMCQRRQSH